MIKINIKNTLTGKELEQYLIDSEESNKTINLSGLKSTKSRIKQRKYNVFLRKIYRVSIILMILSFIFICLHLLLNVNKNKDSVVINKKVTTKTILIPNTNANEVSEPKKYTSIKEILGFDGCKTIQTEEDHIIKGHGSVYAMDVRCKKGVSDKVYAPLWKDTYIIESISYDKRLGDYIVLKHGEYKFVFGHTETGLKVGDRVKAGTHIGNTNKTGMSENHHLHFELWKNDYNISYKEMLGQSTIINMEHSYDLSRQRSWYTGLHDTMKFLSDLEGFRSCPYWDNVRWSIGYGTISKENAPCITKEQAIELKKGNVDDILRHVYQTYYLKQSNQRIALASMLYNRGKDSIIAKFIYKPNEKSARNYVTKFIEDNTSEKYLKGITKRHNLELNLYFNKM